MEFIDLIDKTNRTSSLAVNRHDGFLEVLGGLSHHSSIKPKTKADAKKLADFVTGGEYAALLAVERIAKLYVQEGECYCVPERQMVCAHCQQIEALAKLAAIQAKQ